MALSAGTAFIDLKPKLSDTFGPELKGRLGGAIGTATKFAGGAALGIGAAITTGVVSSIRSFASLEQGLNEVFTLLPGISEEAMGALEDDVKSFAKEFGVLPDAVVPALYQALSAGVPPDNVFDFLATGQKAALGGVTDLETAVDGISSVVNAYGSDVIDAAEASDLMFTAVRLGKTNFEELSGSLFNVIPTAAATGVGFGDITAALAALTAQGTPTSVATTQLRQALVELSKDGSKTSDLFTELSGQTFRDFIAGGGDLQGALEVLAGGASDLGVSVSDLFGSVEAGNAVLGLTSQNGATLFANALDEMGTSAGATDTAFEQMDQGLARTWERIKSTVAVALADIGGRLAPFVERAAEWLGEFLPRAIDAITTAVEVLRPVFETVFGIIGDILGAFRSDAEETEEAGTSSFGALSGVFATVGEVIGRVVEYLRLIFDGLRQFWERWGSTIMSVVQTVFGVVVDVIQGALNVIVGIFDVVIGILTGDWSRAWEGIKNIVGAVLGAIGSVIRGAFELIINIAKGLLTNFGDAIRGGIDRVVGFFRELPGRIFSFLTGLPGRFLQLGIDLIAGLIGGLGDIAGRLAGKLKDGISNAVNKVKSFFGIGSPSKVIAAELGNPLSQGLELGITAGAQGAINALAGVVSAAQDAATTTIRPVDLELARFGTTTGAINSVAGNLPVAGAVAGGGRRPLDTTGGGGGTTLELAAGAIVINNPTPEPASEEIPRTLRRLERRYATN